MSRVIIDQVICAPINSKYGIKLSLDQPLNNCVDLNILRPAVLRQYFGKECPSSSSSTKCQHSTRYTYGSGSGTSSVGIDPLNFVTREMTPYMKCMAKDLHVIINQNRELMNLTSVNLSLEFNHCTVLIYYAGEHLKKIITWLPYRLCIFSLQW